MLPTFTDPFPYSEPYTNKEIPVVAAPLAKAPAAAPFKAVAL